MRRLQKHVRIMLGMFTTTHEGKRKRNRMMMIVKSFWFSLLVLLKIVRAWVSRCLMNQHRNLWNWICLEPNWKPSFVMFVEGVLLYSGWFRDKLNTSGDFASICGMTWSSLWNNSSLCCKLFPLKHICTKAHQSKLSFSCSFICGTVRNPTEAVLRSWNINENNLPLFPRA